MDIDSFLAMPKWQILERVATRPSSPIEIAEFIGTTVSYVSQQLKLLEAMGLVEKTKTGAFLKGKPRSVYSVKEDFVYLTVLSKSFAQKKKLALDARKQIRLRIWFLEDKETELSLERFFVLIDDLLPRIEGAFVDFSVKGLKLIIVSSDDSLDSDVRSRTSSLDLSVSFLKRDSFSKKGPSRLYALYDPFLSLSFKKEDVKGGSEE